MWWNIFQGVLFIYLLVLLVLWFIVKVQSGSLTHFHLFKWNGDRYEGVVTIAIFAWPYIIGILLYQYFFEKDIENGTKR